MTGGGSEAMQVIYMEIEGIKLAYHLTKDAAKILYQIAKYLLSSMAEVPYKKTAGRTNRKNMDMRSNGQAQVPVSMDTKTFREFQKEAKKYGILYRSFHPLKSGKKGTVQVIIMEKDLQMTQELLSRIKEKQIKEDVKNGMEEEQAEQGFDENNHTETMEEFVENVGAASLGEVFEKDMKERFGEDYEAKIIHFLERTGNRDPKSKAARTDTKKVDGLADIIQFKDRAETLRKNSPVKIPFVYDQKNGKSQIVEETETHVKIEGKGFCKSHDPDEWGSIWVPKNSILPPLDQEPGENGMRTVNLPPDADIIIEKPLDNEVPQVIKAEKLNRKQQEQGDKGFDITISKELVCEENDHAVKTRVPGTWGANIRFLWTDKSDVLDAYGGKSILTSLDKDKDYKLYSADNQVAETIKGKQLYRNHYDAVNKSVRGKAKPAGAGRAAGRGRSL